MFNRLKQFRRIATRYDKTALSFTGFLCLAPQNFGCNPLSNRPQVSGMELLRPSR
jgi:hypothetical protein